MARSTVVRFAPCLLLCGALLEVPLHADSPAPCSTPFPETEPNNSAGTADLLASPCYGASGAVSPAGDADYFSVMALNGGRLWLLVDTGSPPAQSGSRDSVLELYDTDGTTLLEADDDDGTGNGGDGTVEAAAASVIAGRVMPATDTFYLRVRQYSTGVIDHYHLVTAHTFGGFQTSGVEPNDDVASANRMRTHPAVRVADLSPAGEADFYSFFGQAGDTIFIAADLDPERDNSNTDVDFELIGPDGFSVLVTASSSGNSGGHGAEGLRYNLLASGLHFVRVFGHTGTETGTYDLLVYGNREKFFDGFESGSTAAWSTTQP